MSTALQLPEEYLANTANSASYRYSRYRITKRRGGKREICHPSRELKALQRWLVAREIDAFPVHGAAMGYRRGIGISANAALHAKGRYLLRLDLTSFFPSIKAKDVDALLKSVRPDWSESDREFFEKLVCRFGQLTIGAPTSPGLSNAVCIELDTRLASMAAARGLVYSRYADDLFFSSGTSGMLGDVEDLVSQTLPHLPYPSGLKINRAKTHHSSRKNRREVTGLVLTVSGHVSVGRRLKRRIRSEVHRYSKLDERARRALAGLIAYVQSIEPDFINALILKYGKAVVDKVRRMS